MNAMSANVGTVIETPKGRRTGSRGRGAATGKNAQAQTRKRPVKASGVWSLDAERASNLGHEMAEAAVKNVQQSANLWDRARTFFVEGQQAGHAEAVVAALFSAGDEIKGKKAPWYRTYKSLLTSAAKLDITVTNEMGVTALQKEIKAAKDEQADPEAKKAQLLGMFLRLAKGCLEKGISKKELASELTKLEV